MFRESDVSGQKSYRPHSYILQYVERQASFIGGRSAPAESMQFVGDLPEKTWEFVSTTAHARELIGVGTAADVRGRSDIALKLWLRAVEAGGSDASLEALIYLGQAYSRADRIEEANDAYERARDSGDPTVAARAILGLAKLYRRKRDVASAVRYYEQAVGSENPDVFFWAALNLGNMYQEQDQIELARREYERAREFAFGGEDFVGAASFCLARLYYRYRDSEPTLEGVADEVLDDLSSLEKVIARGDSPGYDDEVTELVRSPSRLFALGGVSERESTHLLHATVPVGKEVIPMLPVFTRAAFIASAVEMNPNWGALQIVEVDGSVVLSDLDEGEWLGINPWSGAEFKLPWHKACPK